MDVKEAVSKRRAYRSLEGAEIAEGLIRDLAECAGLAPSCFNKQPWRCIFVDDPAVLLDLHGAIAKGNEWTHKAPLIIAVFSARDSDCLIKEREYYLFDTGMATAFLILRATELGLVAHPIAGYDEEAAKKVLGVPAVMRLITLVIVGRHSDTISPVLSEWQVEAEKTRPGRLSFEQFAYRNRYK